ncbi:WD40 repeat-like protein [Piptocephalis cylindrospora]|uniref:WD40 repeat-like protein n=1 Tax=Piptocephalis cylindrospora TaxID=1907219 RepID=A0A4P9Y3L9_9FUNG|nr:WD40 repeat-like protein [Piptocephalis cylindrospora]|eukprot:RKP12721.1 WD40 repeat-like protein [Piptocephalis cylindrospora]
MRTNFQFSNLCGTVYRQGNLLFTPDGNSLLSPVGNRVSLYDLVKNTSETFPFENKRNIARMALSPAADLLVTVDEDGRALLVNYRRRIVLHHFNFHTKINDLQFSPDGRYLAVTHEKIIEIWHAPGFNREFAPFVLYRKYTGHYDTVTTIAWSPDSQYFLTTSSDMTCRVYSLHTLEDYGAVTLSGHRDVLVSAFFSADATNIYTVSRDGSVFVWHCPGGPGPKKDSQEDEDEADEGMGITTAASSLPTAVYTDTEGKALVGRKQKQWYILHRHYFSQPNAKVVCAAFHPESNLLLAGFTTGIFGIWELPHFTNIHTLSISQHGIDTVTINQSGEWLALGSSKLGQLLVWEWQSESYVLKQQGHYHDMACLAYSPDGQYLATGGEDGKVKVWVVATSFCLVTFSEHTAGVTALEFTKQGQVLVSASLDGTVRAHDLTRYRNFRTLMSPQPVQFGSLAVDASGDLVCAGSRDTFEIYVWSMQTGKVLDVLAGHEGPISCLAFSPSMDPLMLVSGSWDRTVRTWDVFGRGKKVERLEHTAEVLALAIRPDGKELAASTLKGDIILWDIAEAKETGLLDGRKDIAGGRKLEDRVTAENSTSGKAFNSIAYSADGKCILGGGNSKYVCLYSIHAKILLRKWTVSSNLSYDGALEMLDSRRMTEAGPMELLDVDAAEDEGELKDRLDQGLPGVRKGDLSLRRVRPEIRTRCVRFSPTGRSWAGAATEGLVIYTLDDTVQFDPFELDLDLTPESTREASAQGEHLRAVVMAVRLGEEALLRQCYEATPPDDVALVVRPMPTRYLNRVLIFVAAETEKTPHIEFHLKWIEAILGYHGEWVRQNTATLKPSLRAVRKAIANQHEHLGKVCNENTYAIQYLASLARRQAVTEDTMEESTEQKPQSLADMF